jgi:hypothetical protein
MSENSASFVYEIIRRDFCFHLGFNQFIVFDFASTPMCGSELNRAVGRLEVLFCCFQHFRSVGMLFCTWSSFSSLKGSCVMLDLTVLVSSIAASPVNMLDERLTPELRLNKMDSLDS